MQAGDEGYFSNDKQRWTAATLLYIDLKYGNESRFATDAGRYRYGRKTENGIIYTA